MPTPKQLRAAEAIDQQIVDLWNEREQLTLERDQVSDALQDMHPRIYSWADIEELHTTLIGYGGALHRNFGQLVKLGVDPALIT